MKVAKLLILLGLTVCLIAPASAWEQSFENHAKDASSSLFSGGTLTADAHGYARYSPTSNLSIVINQPWQGDISYSTKFHRGSVAFEYHQSLKIYNSDGTLCFNYNFAPTYQAMDSYQRIEFAESPSKQGINVFANGVQVGSASYLTTPDYAGYMIISSYNYYGNTVDLWIDDICSSSQMVSCDSTLLSSDSGQYYKTSYSAYTGTSWYSQVISPNGTTLTQTVNSLEEQLIPLSWCKDPGTYMIKLYQNDSSGHGVPMASRTFTYGTPYYRISTDKTDYSPGDLITIDTYSKNYSGYYVEVPYYDSSGKLQTYTYSLNASEQTGYFKLPSTVRGGSFLISLNDNYGGVKAVTQYNCLASGGITDLKIDKTVYAPLDVVKISYANMPSNTQIVIRVQQGNNLLSSKSWGGVTGSGVVTYTIPSTSADNFYVYAISGTTQLGQTTGTIKSGIYYLSGHIINPLDGSLIPGASIVIGTASTISDTNGAFNFSVPSGWQSLSVTKTGYQSNINKVNIVYPVATQDFYLVPSYSGNGHSIYGIITDYYTGAPVSSAFITLKQGSVTHTLFSYTNTGYYIYDAADMTGTWNLTVSKSGYYTYSGTVSLSGDTYKQINLTPLKFSSTGDTGSLNSSSLDGSSGSSGSSGSTTDANTIDATGVSADRPGREAAKNSMAEFEQVVPSLLGLVVFKIVMELLK